MSDENKSGTFDYHTCQNATGVLYIGLYRYDEDGPTDDFLQVNVTSQKNLYDAQQLAETAVSVLNLLQAM